MSYKRSPKKKKGQPYLRKDGIDALFLIPSEYSQNPADTTGGTRLFSGQGASRVRPGLLDRPRSDGHHLLQPAPWEHCTPHLSPKWGAGPHTHPAVTSSLVGCHTGRNLGEGSSVRRPCGLRGTKHSSFRRKSLPPPRAEMISE